METIPMLYVIQKDRHCMPTSDYYFTNLQPDPIIIPPHRTNNSTSKPQQATAEDPIPWQLDTLKPGKTWVYPSMIAEKQVPVLDLTNSTITSAADLQTAFQSLNLCPMEKEWSAQATQAALSYTMAQCNPTVKRGPERKPKIKPLPKEKVEDKTT